MELDLRTVVLAVAIRVSYVARHIEATAIACLLLTGCSSEGPPACGLSSLFACAEQLKAGVKIERIVGLLGGQDNNLVSLYELSAVAQSVGLDAQGIRTDLNGLATCSTAILELDSRHFVAFLGFEDDLPLIVDAAYRGDLRVQKWSRARLIARWTGQTLLISRPAN